MKNPLSTPKFCQKHLKIHVCEEQNIFKKSESVEKSLSEKVRRLHGIQTEEEINKQKKNSKPKPGTIEYILSKAKANIKKEKAKIKNLPEEEGITKIDESELTTRMESLKNKLLNKQDDVNDNNLKTFKINKKSKNIYDIKVETDINFYNKHDNTLEVSLNKLNKKVLKRLNLEDNINGEKVSEDETVTLVKSTIEEVLKEIGYVKKKKNTK
ncbi:hypothetical protein [Spiroplasma turonicum]|uniref:Uncharacterized protein n=1 Tax=Spiroplasma turonicum TaxID=216946 RepID=A0A0K1P6B0_9MOLU|nr:hypothetical protein [Spiroplasma turonicum]AKU79724.1 hypothetical protein STURON_00478 [Spiroplasma turonicum]ALX70742.1 hypothetical protein STURO_v1c04760 [Spiroplasma turonicum]